MDTSDIGTSNRGRGRRGAATPVQPETPGVVVLGPRDSLVGTLSVDGDVRIEGKLEGELSATGEVNVHSTGTAHAQIAAHDIVINGTVEGSSVAQDLVHIGETAIITGDVRSARLRVDEGASVNATISMQASDAPAARRSHDDHGSDEQTVDVTGSAAGEDSESPAYAEVSSGSDSESSNDEGASGSDG